MSRKPNFRRSAKGRLATRSLSVALALLLHGAASLALAQSSKESFADTFARMQALSSNSSNFQRNEPVFSKAAVPKVALSAAEMQALSSDSPAWRIDHGAVELDRGSTFAQTHPHGLSFSQYQAFASNSGEFALPPTADTSSMAATDTANVAARVARPTLRGFY